MLKPESLFYPLFLLIFTAPAFAQQNTLAITDASWIGTYFYEQAFDRNPSSGYVDTIEHTVIVSRKSNVLSVRFTADGVQTQDDYECTVKLVGNRLSLYYLRDLRSADSPGHDRGYRPGDLFGSLTKSVSRGRPVYLFRAKYFFRDKYPGVFKKNK